MSKILLINPPIGEVYTGAKKKRILRPPLGLAYLAGELLKRDMECEIYDAMVENANEEACVRHVLESGYKIIGITSTTPTYHYAMQISRMIKQQDPSICIIHGGNHVSYLPLESLRETQADFVCMGECEDILPDLIHFIDKKTDVLPPRVVTPAHKTADTGFKEMRDLNTIAYPARTLFKNEEYVDINRAYDKVFNSEEEYVMTTTMITSRGCVGKCKFCQGEIQAQRLCSPEYIVGEIEQVYHNYGIRNIFFADDTFSASKSRIIELSNLLRKRNMDITYACHVRLDTINEDFCHVLKDSGCTLVRPGIESGNDDILKAQGKKITKQKMRERCELLHKVGLPFRASYMMGWVDETEDQILDTINFAKDVRAQVSSFGIVTPLPGTWLWNYAVKNKLINPPFDYRAFRFYNSVACNFSKVPGERLLELQTYASDYFDRIGQNDFVLANNY